MTSDRIIERRKHRRISLKGNDGVYCIVATAPSARKTITLPAKDISETGFRFAIVSLMVRDFLTTGKIYLKAIAGSRNLNFQDPVALEIRWRNYDSSRTWMVFGCKIVNISADAKDQLLKFIEAEEKFRGIEYPIRLNGGKPKVEVVRDSKKISKIFPRKILTVSGGSPQNKSLHKVLKLRCSGRAGRRYQGTIHQICEKPFRGRQNTILCPYSWWMKENLRWLIILLFALIGDAAGSKAYQSFSSMVCASFRIEPSSSTSNTVSP